MVLTNILAIGTLYMLTLASAIDTMSKLSGSAIQRLHSNLFLSIEIVQMLFFIYKCHTKVLHTGNKTQESIMQLSCNQPICILSM